jgi:hypothetical protein
MSRAVYSVGATWPADSLPGVVRVRFVDEPLEAKAATPCSLGPGPGRCDLCIAFAGPVGLVGVRVVVSASVVELGVQRLPRLETEQDALIREGREAAGEWRDYRPAATLRGPLVDGAFSHEWGFPDATGDPPKALPVVALRLRLLRPRPQESELFGVERVEVVVAPYDEAAQAAALARNQAALASLLGGGGMPAPASSRALVMGGGGVNPRPPPPPESLVQAMERIVRESEHRIVSRLEALEERVRTMERKLDPVHIT